jgi:hypothetical protein
MRHRHQPRLCGVCRAPMARQQDACSRCAATPWAERDSRAAPAARTRLQLDRSARRHESRPHSGVVGWRAHAATARKRPVPATIEERGAGGSVRPLPGASPRDGGPEPTLRFTRHTRGTIEAERDRRRQRRAHATTAYPTRVTERAAGGPRSRITTAVAENARAVTQARLDMDRWVAEGGMVPFEAAALLRTGSRR